jgi:hypothetical protein
MAIAMMAQNALFIDVLQAIVSEFDVYMVCTFDEIYYNIYSVSMQAHRHMRSR